MDLVEEEEAAMVAVTAVVATGAAIAAVAMVAVTVVAVIAAVAVTVVAVIAAVAVIVVAVIAAAATVVVIALTLINLLEQKVGKTEVMEILLKTLHMKVVGAEEKGECLMRAMLQMRQISNPFLQALLLF